MRKNRGSVWTFRTVATDHLQHSGQRVAIVRRLGRNEADHEVGPMYAVRRVDTGAQFSVFADELSA